MTAITKPKPKLLSEYKDQFTLDGRLKAQPGVTERKALYMQELLNGTLGGSYQAQGLLKEAMTSSDAIFNYAHVLSINLLPQYDALEPTWQLVAGTRTVNDFRPAVLYSLVNRWNAGLDTESAEVEPNAAPHGIAPVVPEGASYPYAYMSGEEAASGGIRKRGFKTDFTFEAFVNDSVGFIRALPSEMLNVAVDTADFDVYNALITGISGGGSNLAGGTIPDGTVVPVNSPLSRAALVRALYELSQRKINNRYVKVTGGYNLIVPIGQKAFVEFWLNQVIAGVTDGSLQLSVSGYNPLANVTVLETEWITGLQWILIPKPGATRRPILDYGYLAGHESPEVRVEDNQGTYVGAADVSPFEGSFDNDSAVFRMRQIGGPILWTASLIVNSTGAGS
jgi:hypothetical protein